MKRRLFRSVLCFALALTLVFCAPPRASAAVGDLIRVGLYYGGNALASANLANEVGSGFQFGYYDDSYRFIPLARTDAEKITMCRDSTFWLSDGVFSLTKPEGERTLIGAYHLQLGTRFSSYDEAAAAAESYPYGFVAWGDGAYWVRFEFYSTVENADDAKQNYDGCGVVGESPCCITVVDSQTGRILFELDEPGLPLAVAPDGGSERAQTWFRGYRYHGCFQYRRDDGGNLTVINVLPLEQYLQGVVPYEFIIWGGMEQLRASTIAARTFCCVNVKHAELGFDVCSTVDCQVYHGIYTDIYADRVTQAVNSTAGKKLYYDGSLIQAMYFSASGGKIESSYNAWHWGYPYLIAHEDPFEGMADFSSKYWSYTVTPEQVRTMLRNRGENVDAIRSVEVTGFTEIGNVGAVTFTDVNGKSVTYTGDSVRCFTGISGVGYFSRSFTVTPNYAAEDVSYVVNTAEVQFSVFDGKNVTEHEQISVLTADGVQTVSGDAVILTDSGTVSLSASRSAVTDAKATPVSWTLTGSGYGHNVGLSQWGAYVMAEQGYSCEEILEFYYPGTILQ